MSEPTVAGRRWEDLPPFTGEIAPDDQVLVVSATGGAKSTLIASLTLDVASLVVIDSKGRLTLPRARVAQLPEFDPKAPDRYDAALRDALAWQRSPRQSGWDRLRGVAAQHPTDRVILRPAATDVDDPAPHDRIFRAIMRYRPDTLVWVDEITGTGATSHVAPRHLRALSSRGRTQGTGLITDTQAPYGLTPGILRRNARILIVGVIEPEDVRDVHRREVEIALSIPPKSGRFMVWVAGDRDSPYRLYVPIPPALQHWEAP